MMPWVTFALWIVPLVGRLHAASLAREPSLSMEALSFNLLAELSCVSRPLEYVCLAFLTVRKGDLEFA